MKKTTILPIVLFVALFCACSAKETTVECFAMDTVMTVKAYGENSAEAVNSTIDTIYRLEKIFSATDPNSELYQLNSDQTAAVSEDLFSILKKSLQLSETVDGAFDCSIGPVLDAWGWYGSNPAVPNPERLRNALALVGYENIKLQSGTVSLQNDMSLDLGGIAKGYTAGQIAETLTEYGVTSALVDLGGNIRAVGTKPDGSPWTIGIDDPSGNTPYLATVAVSDLAVVTSGTSQRYFEENGSLWHHIINPETGWPVDNDLLQVTVFSEDDTLADGLSTALFVMGLEAAVDFWRSGVYSFDAVFITKDGAVYVTDGLDDTFRCDLAYEVIVH